MIKNLSRIQDVKLIWSAGNAKPLPPPTVMARMPEARILTEY